MQTYTIGQLPNTATEINKEDYLAIWQNGATKKISFQDLEKSGTTAGGLAFVGTRAQYEVAKLIPEGEDGYIPSGTLVCITDENSYVKGEEIENV